MNKTNSRFNSADTVVTDEFAERNMGLVHSLAHRFRGRGIEYEELFSAGCVGLVKAAKCFDTSRGLQFSTYAVPVILGEIKRLFRDGGAIKVSRGLKELSLKVARTRDMLSQSGVEPRLSDIAEALGITTEQVSEALSVNLPPVSLTDSDESGNEYDLPVEAPQTKLTELIALKQSLGQLAPEDRKLIILRYWQNKTQGETGALLGMSQVQVSRRERKILDELKRQLA
ncbi:MAG: sigma-70 family RNA polymerase sigma factor [Oscillospiraceae bacterium]|jgi:RNA polymerase sporulation-specific sigma factor|nr:sigma-70 family RNA polymerase sigma factor [Oscillospiraceae bacterium]